MADEKRKIQFRILFSTPVGQAASKWSDPCVEGEGEHKAIQERLRGICSGEKVEGLWSYRDDGTEFYLPPKVMERTAIRVETRPYSELVLGIDLQRPVL